MEINTEIAIIGGGIIGASIAHYLTVFGQKDVVLCEQDRPPGIGATKMSGGLIRMSHTHSIQAKLAWESYETFINWEETIGGSCGFNKTGFALLVGEERKNNLVENTNELNKIGIPINLIRPQEFQKMQPNVSMEGVSIVAHEPLSGYGNPNLATLGFINKAKNNGLKVMEGTKVTGFKMKNSKVCGVTTNIGNINAEKVIICSGAWTARFFDLINVPSPIEWKNIGINFFRCENNLSTSSLMTYIDDVYGCYFRPLSSNEILVGVSSNNGKQMYSTEKNMLDTDDVQLAYETINKRILNNNFKPLGGRYGFDAYTPDKHPVIGDVKGIDGIYIATGFSGGGFKIAPAIGKLVAKEILEGNEEACLSKLRLHRFEEGNLIVPQKTYTYM
nr:FAD-dependent oxidoreductase [Bacillus cereus]